ncbi:MAG TPA: hypothetical protein VMD91_10065 [Candidatus Sulfotelmatobacter sp.]|nr:hypothetical protein [Candidatus Sulfotelmatobacter sp.]
MRELCRRIGVTCIALALVLVELPGAAQAAPPQADGAHALALLNNGCGASPDVAVSRTGAARAASAAAQAATAEYAADPGPAVVAQDESPSPEPTESAAAGPTATPTATPTPLVGRPFAPSGPQQLLPPPLPTPAVPTVPPVPTPTPSPGSPPPAAVQQYTAPPSMSPIPFANPSSGPVRPTPTASPTPVPEETLGPSDYAILGDKLTGTDKPGKPYDLDGHVTLVYQDGVVGGDHAHYDGVRYIDITGNTFVRNRESDTVLYADAIRFDTLTERTTLIHGRGESTQGVQSGKLHFTGSNMVTTSDGVTHVERANFTTCENPRGGYHMESKTLDIYPGNKAVAKSDVLYLGALAVLWLPIVVISLAPDRGDRRHQARFIPLIGYDATEGFWIKAQIGFAPSQNYFGYYRVEYYTKVGLGLGYVATIRKKDGRRQTDINFFNQQNRLQGGNQTNFQLQDQEAFSRTTRAQVQLNYQGNYGPLVTLPAEEQITAAVDHGDAKGDREDYSFNRTSNGSVDVNDDYGFTDHRQFSQNFTNDLTLSYTTSSSSGLFGGTTSDTLHFEDLLDDRTPYADYSLTFDKYDGAGAGSIDKEPELLVRPIADLFPHINWLPVTGQYTAGYYYDTEADLATGRMDGKFQAGPVLAHFFDSDFSGEVTVEQDLYATGDEKANIQQQFSLTTPIWGHIVNEIQYTESHVNGPLAEPFQELDVFAQGLKQASDVLRIFNDSVYTVSLTGSTYFNRQAQSVGYQVTMQPSPRSVLLLGGDFEPGPGEGFDRTSVQMATPFGRDSELQISTFIDWRNHMRLEDKDIYYRHIVGNCYEIQIDYNQDLKQVSLSISLLAFPTEGANFGIGQAPSLNGIIPQSFSSSTGFTGGAAGAGI